MRQLFTLASIFMLLYLIISQLWPWISGVFGAIVLYVLTKNMMKKLVRNGWKRWLAASVMLIFTIIVILLPIISIILLLTRRVRDVVSNSEKYSFLLKSNISKIESFLGIDLTAQLDGMDLQGMVAKFAQGAAGSTLDATIIIGLMYILLYYMLVNFDKMKEALRDYFPMSNKNFERISKESTEIVKSNAIAIPLVALLQGLVALLGFYIFDVPNPIFWFAVTAVGSMIPFIGTFIGLAPTVFILYSQGDTNGALGLAIYGMAVVGSTDNIFRMIVQKKLAEIHPVITLVGVVVGIPLFGFLGLVFGPLIISLFILLAKIYKEEYYTH